MESSFVHSAAGPDLWYPNDSEIVRLKNADQASFSKSLTRDKGVLVSVVFPIWSLLTKSPPCKLGSGQLLRPRAGSYLLLSGRHASSHPVTNTSYNVRGGVCSGCRQNKLRLSFLQTVMMAVECGAMQMTFLRHDRPRASNGVCDVTGADHDSCWLH